MKLASLKKVRWTCILILLIVGFTTLLTFPKYFNQAVTWSNTQLDKFKYIDQLNIPSVRDIPFSLGLDLQGGVHLVYSADVSQIRGTDEEEAVEGVRDVIENRINILGISEPSVRTSKIGDGWRIIVEIPGVSNASYAIDLIGDTPILEFKELYQDEDLDLTPEEQEQLERKNAESLVLASDLNNRIAAGESFEEIAKQYSQDSTRELGGDLGFAKRGDFVPEFEKAIFDDLAVGEITPEPVETAFGWHIIKKEEERGEGDDREVRARHILIIKTTAAGIRGVDGEWKNTPLSGKNLATASVTFDPNTGVPLVSLSFDNEGEALFSEITERNVGKPIAIFLDGEAITVPVVQQQIDSGGAVITGDFTLPEARDLARRLNAGALPVPIHLELQEFVGASLGEESLAASLSAGMVGLILISIFMILFYRLPGVIALLALGVYGLILLVLFKYIPVTLTLAGIAGFILSFGMAVDANILVFERLKEELAAKKPLGHALEEAFKRAWSSIRDGNASTLITCFILFGLTTSSVQGFAVTLALGIFVSLFTALTVTRTLMRLLARWKLLSSVWLWGGRNDLLD